MRKRGEIIYTAPICAYGHNVKKSELFDPEGEDFSSCWSRTATTANKYVKKTNGYVRCIFDFIEEMRFYVECRGPKRGAMPNVVY